MASVRVLLLISAVLPCHGEMYSLLYMNTIIWRSVSSGELNEFSSSVKLNDVQMSVCTSENKAAFLSRFCEESQRLFRNQSDELSLKQRWLQNNLNTLMMRNDNGTNHTNLHVLQWRRGCAAQLHSNGSVHFLQGTDEYAYDGETLTFDPSALWIASVHDSDVRESVSNLESRCVQTLCSLIDLQRQGKLIVESRPAVFSSVRASGSPDKQLLVCLATGFYPKYIQMEIRRCQKRLPDKKLKSEGIRANADGSFQLMKSLEILPSERSQYECVVKHQTLTEPHVTSCGEVNLLLPVVIGCIVTLVALVIILLLFCLLRKYHVKRQKHKRRRRKRRRRKRRQCKRRKRKRQKANRCEINKPSCSSSTNSGKQTERGECCSRKKSAGDYEHEFYIQRRLRMLSEPLEEIKAETHAGQAAAALNADSDAENTSDHSTEDVVHNPELPETQSLGNAEVTPAGAPTAARGAMGSKNISLPNFAMEREDPDQNTVTQNLLQLPLPRRCRSKNISLPNLILERKDSSDSS